MMQITRSQRRLLVTLVATAAGGLAGFAPALISAGLAFALYTIMDNVMAIRSARHKGSQGPDEDAFEVQANWVGKWQDELRTSPAHKGVAGNIWNEPHKASRD